jgi:heme/copper-type cytochrome/quinol oxidase subunit 2
MKITMRGLIFVLLAVGGTALLAGNANARISMPEREHVQAVVWLGEFISFVTAVVIAVFVWRISKRDSKNKKTKRDDS